jgi:hypothetical protein
VSRTSRCLLIAALLLTTAASPSRLAAEELLFSSGRLGSADLRWGDGTCGRESGGALRWLACTTGGEGDPIFVATKRFASPRDLRGRFVEVWLRVEHVEHLAGLELRLSSDDFAESFFAFELPLFADPHFNLIQAGKWTRLTLSFGSARVVGAPDRAAIDAAGWFLRDDAGGPVKLAWSDLSAHATAKEGRLSLTFDDGVEGHYAIAATEMKRFGFRGTAYVMPDQIGGRGFMSLEQLRALRDRFGWEVAAHYDVPLTDLERDELEPTLLGVKRFLHEHGFDPGSGHLAFPLGRHEHRYVMPAVREHFRTARLASAGPETIPPADPHRLRVVNVLDSTTPAEIEAVARRARVHGEWVILMFHHLVPRPESPLEYGIQDFVRALERIRASRIPVRPVGEVWAEIERGLVALPANRRGERR